MSLYSGSICLFYYCCLRSYWFISTQSVDTTGFGWWLKPPLDPHVDSTPCTWCVTVVICEWEDPGHGLCFALATPLSHKQYLLCDSEVKYGEFYSQFQSNNKFVCWRKSSLYILDWYELVAWFEWLAITRNAHICFLPKTNSATASSILFLMSKLHIMGLVQRLKFLLTSDPALR